MQANLLCLCAVTTCIRSWLFDTGPFHRPADAQPPTAFSPRPPPPPQVLDNGLQRYPHILLPMYSSTAAERSVLF